MSTSTVWGAAAALLAAALWSVASIIYGRLGLQIPPLLLNLAKGLVAIVLLLVTLAAQSQLGFGLGINPPALSLLALSGLIGIGLGDTAYFHAINNLGARRSLLLDTLAAPLSAVLAMIFLQENLGNLAWLGMFCTLGGVAWVISEGTPDLPGKSPRLGLSWAIVSAVSQAVGSVLSRSAFMLADVNTFGSSLIRITSGLIVIMIWLSRIRGFTMVKTYSYRLWLGLAGAAFLGTYMGIWLQQVSLKLAPTGIAQTLLSTSPLFILPLAAVLGDRISKRAVLGAVISVGGIVLLFTKT
jgi:drug/metabolite transporter (DMT)-like permease